MVVVVIFAIRVLKRKICNKSNLAGQIMWLCHDLSAPVYIAVDMRCTLYIYTTCIPCGPTPAYSRRRQRGCGQEALFEIIHCDRGSILWRWQLLGVSHSNGGTECSSYPHLGGAINVSQPLAFLSLCVDVVCVCPTARARLLWTRQAYDLVF